MLHLLEYDYFNPAARIIFSPTLKLKRWLICLHVVHNYLNHIPIESRLARYIRRLCSGNGSMAPQWDLYVCRIVGYPNFLCFVFFESINLIGTWIALKNRDHSWLNVVNGINLYKSI
jgi:hypothetical protein